MTFSDGTKAKEQLISRDDKIRRGVWRWVDSSVIHDTTTMQVHDVSPDSAAEWSAPTMDKLVPLFQQPLNDL